MLSTDEGHPCFSLYTKAAAESSFAAEMIDRDLTAGDRLGCPVRVDGTASAWTGPGCARCADYSELVAKLLAALDGSPEGRQLASNGNCKLDWAKRWKPCLSSGSHRAG